MNFNPLAPTSSFVSLISEFPKISSSFSIWKKKKLKLFTREPKETTYVQLKLYYYQKLKGILNEIITTSCLVLASEKSIAGKRNW